MLEPSMTPPSSELIANGCLQHVSPELRVKHCCLSHVYLRPENVKLLDAKAFEYQTGLCIVVDYEKQDAVEWQLEVADLWADLEVTKYTIPPFLMSNSLLNGAGQ